MAAPLLEMRAGALWQRHREHAARIPLLGEAPQSPKENAMKNDDFIVGQKPRFPAEFRQGSTLVDPTTVKFIFQRPDSDPIVLVYSINPEVIRTAAGRYQVDLLLDVSGTWHWRWESAGIVDAAKQDKFYVSPANPIG
jgi:hypothetical protein